jgi:hypothetical protein
MATLYRWQLLVAVALMWTAAGCRTGDPSCSVQRELCDDHCLRCFYCPQCTTDCFGAEPWYRSPTRWTPGCNRVRAESRRVRPLPTADVVFALPQVSLPD